MHMARGKAQEYKIVIWGTGGGGLLGIGTRAETGTISLGLVYFYS